MTSISVKWVAFYCWYRCYGSWCCCIFISAHCLIFLFVFAVGSLPVLFSLLSHSFAITLSICFFFHSLNDTLHLSQVLRKFANIPRWFIRFVLLLLLSFMFISFWGLIFQCENVFIAKSWLFVAVVIAKWFLNKTFIRDFHSVCIICAGCSIEHSHHRISKFLNLPLCSIWLDMQKRDKRDSNTYT